VHRERRELAGDLVHVRDHQEQALRRSERRGLRACLQRAVQRAGSATFGLHFGYLRRDPHRFVLPRLAHSSHSSAIGELG
jgi:hypothetical protein